MTYKFISIEGIAKRYPGAGGGEIAVFEDLWLSMARGELGNILRFESRLERWRPLSGTQELISEPASHEPQSARRPV